ncbi:SigE family RNA polymerase sigma factor [Aestuariimicrobium soli]|uniref:SigE family RNA polymerase sigma factor n=1 Tax=Aestuariimicrobium soli TaxID=2035834 RepID=UPI003EBE08A0
MDEDFAELADAQSRSLMRLAWVLTGDAESAADLVQDALCRGFVKRRLVLRADQPAAYLKRLLVNQWGSRRPRREWVTDQVPETAHGDPRDRSTDDRLVLVRALADLSPQQRAVVALRYVDDLSVRDTALVAGCSEQAVTTQCARALATLRRDPRVADLVEGITP